MSTTFDLPGRVRSIRTFDREAGRVVVQTAERLLLLDHELEPIGTWDLPEAVCGLADADPVSDRVVHDDGTQIVLCEHGEQVWSVARTPWAGAESGGVFFAGGHCFAVVAGADGTSADLLRLSVADGSQTGRLPLDVAPTGLELVTFPDGRVAVTIGEGETAAHAWVLDPHADELTAEKAPWHDRVLTDVHVSGRWVLTCPAAGTGPLHVITWPGQDLVWEVDPPGRPGSRWLAGAVFVRDDLVAAYAPAGDDETDPADAGADHAPEGEVLRIPPRQPITKVGAEVWPAPGGPHWWLDYDGERLTRRAG